MKKEVKILLAIVVLVVIAGVVGASFYRKSIQGVPAAGAKIPEELTRPDSPGIGPTDAKVTVVEFYDPECGTCAAFHPIVEDLLKEFDGKVRFVARYATFHKNARIAAIYTEAAGEQGKYWEMQEKLFAKQSEWGEQHGSGPQPAPAAAPTAKFEQYAAELGLNVEQFKASAADPKHAAKVDRDMRDVNSLKVVRTPTFYVNGRMLAKLGQQDLKALISEELAK